jgi:hypothetical protein
MIDRKSAPDRINARVRGGAERLAGATLTALGAVLLAERLLV